MSEQPLEPWQQALAEHTGQWAFVLTLSRRMVFFLTLIRDGDYWRSYDRDRAALYGRHRNHFISANGSLEQRGLIVRVSMKRKLSNGEEIDAINYKLTPAGVVVCRLLVWAGVMPDKRRAARQREKSA